jgi:hypothetical protein
VKVVCQPYVPAAFTPIKYSWYSFSLEAESTPGPQCGRKDYVNEKIPITPSGIFFIYIMSLFVPQVIYNVMVRSFEY